MVILAKNAHLRQTFPISFSFRKPRLEHALKSQVFQWLSGSVADLERGVTGAHPPKKKIDRLCFPPPPPFCITMLKNKAQIAPESIRLHKRASRALKRALDPAIRDFGLRACDVLLICSHNLLHPPK